MIRPLLVAAALTAACASDPAPVPGPVVTDPDSAAAHAEAAAWLALVDAGDWQASYDRAAPLLRQMTGSAADWGAFVRNARSRYTIGERRVVSWEPDHVAPGAPPGEYARVTFASGGTTERVVLGRTEAGWRVAMYGLGG